VILPPLVFPAGFAFLEILSRTNTLAYFDVASVTQKMSLMTLTPGGRPEGLRWRRQDRRLDRKSGARTRGTLASLPRHFFGNVVAF